MAGFRLDKWYFDCVSPEGDVLIGYAIAGMLVMMVDSPAAPPPSTAALLPALAVGAVFFVVCGLAMGVDFPESQRRFSRLSG